jgi:imidazolonepropionase-like amidohydrolase
MRLTSGFHCGLLAALALSAVAERTTFAQSAGDVILFEGARLISGAAGPPIDASAFLVERGAITRVGGKGEVTAPANARRVDLTGKTVMPPIVNTHGHPGFQRGLTYTADNYTRDTVIADLNRALYFGINVVLSQGIEKGDLLYDIRAEQRAGTLGGARLLVAGRGIGAPNAGPGGATYAGIAYEITTEAQARQSVAELAARHVDIVKIWVDDRNGRAPRLSAPLYRAVIDEGHKRGLRVNAHVFYHADAVDLVEAGIDGFAHLVRDIEMDDALVAAIVKRGVYVMGNLSSPERTTHASVPAWLADGDPMLHLLSESVPADVIERMKRTFASRNPTAAAAAKGRYAVLQRSLAKLNRAGARIVLGADTGLEDHLFGLAEQLELQAMVEAGLSPAQGIVAATSRSAEYLHLNDTGTLAAGKRADFLVLDANPLDDITNARRISRTFIGGVEIDRGALSATLR